MREHGVWGERFVARHSRRNRTGGRLWFGIVILGLGVLWTLDNLGFVDSERVLDWWPLVLIAFGLSKLLGRDGARPLAAALWVGAGLLLLGHNLGLLPWGFDDLWPLLLIALGVSIIRKALRGPRTLAVGAAPIAGGASAGAEVTDADTFSCTAVWSGVDRTVTSQSFRGGDYTAIMGGGQINLHGARPAPEGAVIEVFIVMGGMEIHVPEDWHVVNQLHALLGGIADTRNAIPLQGGPVLYLKGTVVMGGIEIKN